MKRIALSMALICMAIRAICANGSDTLLQQLNHAVENKAQYDTVKLKRIAAYQRELTKAPDLNTQYDICLNLYNEFKAFNYNKAFMYSRKLQQLGQQLNEPAKISYGKIKMGFTMLSSGMFKEAFDALKTVDAKLLPDSAKMEYYLLTARTYYDLADYDKDEYFTTGYNKLAGTYIDS